MKQTYLAHSKRHFYQRPREKQAPRFGRTSFSETPATAVSEKLVRAEFNTDTVARNSLDRVQKRKNVLAGSRRCFQIRCDDRYSSAPPCCSPPNLLRNRRPLDDASVVNFKPVLTFS